MTCIKYRKTITAILCILLFACMNTNVYSASIKDSEVKVLNKQHISDEVFDGYEGLETTRLGTTGFNYAFLTADKNKEVLIGFNPNLTQKNCFPNSFYQMGLGWQVKLPFLDNVNNILYQADGYKYAITKVQNEYFVDYPGTSNLTATLDGFCFEKADGSKEIYSNDGKIQKVIDAFGNETTYIYSSGVLTQIIYPDNSFITFERDLLKIELKYTINNDTTVLATLSLMSDKDGTKLLDTIKYDGSNLKFSYEEIRGKYYLSTVSVENKYCKEMNYDKDNACTKSIETLYSDGTIGIKEFYYDAQGRVSKMIDQGVVEEQYQYEQKADGSLLIETTTIVNDSLCVDKETLNKYGQLTRYEENGTVLNLQYNKYNKVQQEKENNKIINYSYNSRGKVTLVTFPDGKTMKYDYYPNGQIQKEITSEQTTYYDPKGEIQTITSADQMLFNSTNLHPIQKVLASGISVLYNINSSVGVTNYHTYYGLSQSGFNCYSFAIGKTDRVYNPGYFSNRSLNLNSVTGIKTNVEKDVQSLGMSIYNTNVSAAIEAHCWKIALKIRAGADYHFMMKSRTADWRFKAGRGGPVMQVLSGKTPSSITWDMYKKSGSKYVVHQSAYYNSALYYMMIRD